MPAAGDVARTSLLLIFAFAGIEVALVPSGEVRDTARTVPRADRAGHGGHHGPVHRAAGGGAGRSRRRPGAGHGLAAGRCRRRPRSADGRASLLLSGASISMFGYLGGMTLSMPRMLFALARDGFLPRALAAVHPVYRSPHAAIVVQSALTLAWRITGTFEKLAILANVSALALYLGLRAGGVAAAADGHRGRRHGHGISRAARPA